MCTCFFGLCVCVCVCVCVCEGYFVVVVNFVCLFVVVLGGVFFVFVFV